MPEDAAKTSGEHLYGAQEAAEFLGIHRSTLHLAVTNHVLAPDRYTPGGHLRFRRATLEGFAARLKREPATNNPHVLSELVDTLSERQGDVAFCHRAFARIRQAVPEFTMYAVVLSAPTPRDPYALDQLAEDGFPPNAYTLFTQLRPDLEFASTTVLRTHAPEICEDTLKKMRRLRLGTVRLAPHVGMRAFAIIPILVKDTILGLLIVASPKPHAIPPAEVSFLQSIAADLGIALSCHDHLHDLRSGLLAVAELTVRAHALHAEIAALAARDAADRGSHEAAHERLLRAIGELRAIFLRGSAAEEAFPPGSACAEEVALRQIHQASGDAGPSGSYPDVLAACASTPACGCVSRQLSELLQRARHSPLPLREEWTEADGVHTAIAVSLPVEGGRRLTAGASWRGQRLEPDADEVLLLAFGGACALVMGAAAVVAVPPRNVVPVVAPEGAS